MSDSIGNITPGDLQFALRRQAGKAPRSRMLAIACRSPNNAGNKVDIRAGGAEGGPEGPGQEVEIFRSAQGTPDQGTMVTLGFSVLNPNMGTTAAPKSSRQQTGPIVGIVAFTNGSAPWDRVEFDVPIVGGTTLTIPAGNFVAACRNDAGVVPQVVIPPMDTLGSAGEPTTVTAWAAYGTRGSVGQLWNTQYYAGPLGIGIAGPVAVPRYAKTYQILRAPANTSGASWVVTRSDGTVLDGPYAVAAGVIPPVMRIPANAAFVIVTPVAAIIARGSVVFEIGL